MIIKLHQDATTSKIESLIIELSEKISTFSVEIQHGLINHYDIDLALVQIEIHDIELITAILSELEKLLNNPAIKIIRKAA